MKNSPKLLLTFVFIFLFAITAYFARRQDSPQTFNSIANEPTVDPYTPTKVPPQLIPITADNNSFSPNFLNLVQHQDAILKVEAVDQDYIFELREFDISAFAPMGEITEILLPGAAIGTFDFICGDTCRGKVRVVDNDEDQVFE